MNEHIRNTYVKSIRSRREGSARVGFPDPVTQLQQQPLILILWRKSPFNSFALFIWGSDLQMAVAPNRLP